VAAGRRTPDDGGRRSRASGRLGVSGSAATPRAMPCVPKPWKEARRGVCRRRGDRICGRTDLRINLVFLGGSRAGAAVNSLSLAGRAIDGGLKPMVSTGTVWEPIQPHWRRGPRRRMQRPSPSSPPFLSRFSCHDGTWCVCGALFENPTCKMGCASSRYPRHRQANIQICPTMLRLY